MADCCPVCEEDYIDPYVLKCRHIICLNCLRLVFEATHNKFTEETHEPLKTKCPLCRYELKREDLPNEFFHIYDGRIGPVLTALDDGTGKKPVRMCRIQQLINRDEVRQLIDKLVSQSKTVGTREPVPSTSSDQVTQKFSEITLQPIKIKIKRIELSIARQILEQIDERISQSQSQDKQETSISEITPNNEEVPPPITTIFDREEGSDAVPMRIIGTWAYGLHMRYKMLWSDHRVTLLQKKDILANHGRIYDEFKKESNRRASRIYRLKKKYKRATRRYRSRKNKN